MNKSALLASAAAIDSLILLNQGRAATTFSIPITINQTTAPLTNIVTVGTSQTECPGNCTWYPGAPGSNTTYNNPLWDATNSIANDYSKPYDVQVYPGVYGTPHKIDFNGTLEGMGTIASGITLGNGTVVSTTAPGVIIQQYSGQVGQAMMIVGTTNSPYPGANLIFKNIEFDGTITSGSSAGKKQPACVQMQAIGAIQVQGMAFINCQMGIFGDPWTPTDGSGVLLISGNVFQNNCSNASPDHSIYESTGTLAVGTVTVSMNGVNVTGTPNIFGECSIGYNTKSRALHTYVEGNLYYQNFVCPSSGAVDIPESSTALVSGNTVTLGPLTGGTCSGVTTTREFARIGGTLGSYNPSNWTFQGNTIISQGATVPINGVTNLQNLPGSLTLTGNKFPLASQTASPLIGIGTIAAGNIYADGSTITPNVNNLTIQGYPVLADYRGVGGPQTANPAGQTVWGGNGLLTSTYTSTTGGMIAGGPGGINLTFPHGGNSLWAWTGINSSNTINIVNGNLQIFTFGTNDQVGIGTIPGSGSLCSSKDPIMGLAGTVTVTINTHNGTTGSSVCDMKVENGATMNLISDYWASTNVGQFIEEWPGATVTMSGKDVRPSIEGTNSTFITNNLSLISSTNTMMFSGTISGGGWISGPAAVCCTSGTITAINGWNDNSYESSSGAPVVTRNDPVSIAYACGCTGGGTIYAGIDKATVTGSTRALGPQPRQVALHVQSAAAGSSINGYNSPVAIYLDGPGTATATTNSNSQAPTYVEIDINGTGSIEVLQPWSISQGDSCHLGAGVTQVGSIHSGGADTLTFSNGGTAKFDGSSGVACS